MNYKSKFTGKQIDDGIDKANSAYQKPQNGIPPKDLSEGVQNSLDNALQSITTMEGTVSTAESERVSAEQGREKEMSDYMLVIKKPIVSTSEETLIMDANKFYKINIGTMLTLDINPPQDTAITNDWEGCFDTGSSAPTVTWPGNVNWGTSYMTLAINMHYEFNIRQSGDKLYGILYGWNLN